MRRPAPLRVGSGERTKVEPCKRRHHLNRRRVGRNPRGKHTRITSTRCMDAHKTSSGPLEWASARSFASHTPPPHTHTQIACNPLIAIGLRSAAQNYTTLNCCIVTNAYLRSVSQSRRVGGRWQAKHTADHLPPVQAVGRITLTLVRAPSAAQTLARRPRC
jgi:hypothetical protein